MPAFPPKAISAHHDRKSGRIVVDLSSKLTLSFSPDDVQGLENAKPSQLDEIEITPSGFGIHFPKLDADLYVPGLLEALLGSRKWMASSWRPIHEHRLSVRLPEQMENSVGDLGRQQGGSYRALPISCWESATPSPCKILHCQTQTPCSTAPDNFPTQSPLPVPPVVALRTAVAVARVVPNSPSPASL